MAAERIRTTIAGWPPESTAVILVSRGSSDPDANADLFKVSRLLWHGRLAEWVEPAFVSLAPPSVPEALVRARQLGAARIAVVPYFLFPGVLVDRVRVQTQVWSDAHPDIDVRTGPELGPDARLADLVVARYQEAVAGDVRMNCDSLGAYRGRSGGLRGSGRHTAANRAPPPLTATLNGTTPRGRECSRHGGTMRWRPPWRW